MGIKTFINEIKKYDKLFMDTNVILYFLEGNEIFGDMSKEIFSLVKNGDVQGYMSVISVAELLVKPLKLNDNILVDSITKFINHFPNLKIVDIDKNIALQAAQIRAKTGLKLPDALIIASAKAFGCGLIGTDTQWEQKSLGIKFLNIKKHFLA
ncbi:type II toxin-antitoxin system VapC family toxin [Thermoanaerobacterium sp. DL9XJH110]|uniref:type II toxin-antitoxin system VapC family toxin n=1 Tax=Thermoanaerobacterium sp. DL9XJH110 TaxID=3386643 RepID=UPI003BB4E5D4